MEMFAPLRRCLLHVAWKSAAVKGQLSGVSIRKIERRGNSQSVKAILADEPEGPPSHTEGSLPLPVLAGGPGLPGAAPPAAACTAGGRCRAPLTADCTCGLVAISIICSSVRCGMVRRMCSTASFIRPGSRRIKGCAAKALHRASEIIATRQGCEQAWHA